MFLIMVCYRILIIIFGIVHSLQFFQTLYFGNYICFRRQVTEGMEFSYSVTPPRTI
jgi:hypothetical protein